jgi:methionyl-tRNA synthetase
VWVYGWLLAQGERMSNSRGNFLDPLDVAAALGSDGTRYCSLREVAFDRDSDVSWDSFVRRYNADLANDLGNLVNRSVTMVNRYLDGERPAATNGGPLEAAWGDARAAWSGGLEGYLLHESLAGLWTLVTAANQLVDLEKPWVLAKAVSAGDAGAGERLRGVLGDLLEACRLLALAAAPFMPQTAPRILAQLGYTYPYGPDGNGGPPLEAELIWGAHAGDAGRVGTAEPVFPRLDLDVAAPTA